MSRIIVVFIVSVITFHLHKDSYGYDIRSTNIVRGHYDSLTAWSTVIHERTEDINNNTTPLLTGLIATGDRSGEVFIRRFPASECIVSRFQTAGEPIKKLMFSPLASKLAIITSEEDGYDISDTDEEYGYDISNTDKIYLLTAKDKHTCLFESVCSLSPRLKGEILSIHFSHNENYLEIFIRGATETAKEVFDISKKPPQYDADASKTEKFKITDKNSSTVKSGSTEETLNSEIIPLIEINTVYTAKGNVDADNYFSQIQKLIWTEKQLIGAESFLSPNGKTAATLYPNGTMVLWDAAAGHTLAKYDFHLPFYGNELLNNGEWIERVKFSSSGNEILLLTNKSVIIFDISDNKVKAVCFPPLSVPRAGMSMSFSFDDVVDAVLYQDKILLVKTMDLILVYKLDCLKNPVLSISIYTSITNIEGEDDEEDNEVLFSTTGRYFVQLRSRQTGRSKVQRDCFLWDCRTLSKRTLSCTDTGFPVMFSCDDKYLLFQKEPENVKERYSFYRMPVETMLFEPLDLLNNIEEKINTSKKQEDKKCLLDVLPDFRFLQESSGEPYFFEQYRGYTLIFSREDFCFLDILASNDASLPDWQGVSRLDKHSVVNIDSNKSPMTLFFGTDDYLVIYSNNPPTGSQKGLNRLCPHPKTLEKDSKPDTGIEN